MIEIYNKDLAKAINLQLYFMGQNRVIDDNVFTEDEINSINKINLINAQSIAEIDKLSNLEILNIGYDDYDYTDDFVNNSIDFELISKISNLKQLIILNNITLKKIDVSKLTKLENLKIIYNPLLTEISGLDQLSNLQNVIIIGNNVKQIDAFTEFINNNKNLNSVLLDISLYPSLSEYFNTNETLKDYISFVEKISFGEIYTTNHLEIKEIHAKACNIIASIINDNMDLYTKITNIYKYVITNLIYDYEGLDYRNDYYINHQYNAFENSETMNKFRRMNTSIEAFKNGCVVCEGYVNMMIYLLNLIGVKAKSIKVKNKGTNSHYDHVAMCYEYNDEIYYADPQKEEDFINLKRLFNSYEAFNDLYDIYPMDEWIIKKWKDEIYDQNVRNIERKK